MSPSLAILRRMFQFSAPATSKLPLSVLKTADPVLLEDTSLHDIVPRYPSRVRQPHRRYLPETEIWN